jgi:tetratricopeptide (TPR) repeat protein
MRGGEWNGERIISREWIEESTTAYSRARARGYAYMWWTDVPEGRPNWYFALGYGGHIIGVNPAEKIVAVQRVDTYAGKSVRLIEATAVIKAIMDAKVTAAKPSPVVVPFNPLRASIPAVRLRREVLDRYVKTYTMRGQEAEVKRLDTELLLESPSSGNFKLYPLSKKKFFVEDLEWYAVFDFEGGAPFRLTLHRTGEVADFYTDIVGEGVGEAIRRYRGVVSAGGPAFAEREMNTLGYELLGTGQIDAAVAVFEINAEAHPSSYNVYDSLGEAYMNRGDSKKAIGCFEKSLELNPKNVNAEEKLRELRAQSR